MKSNKKKTIIIAVTSTVVGVFAIIGAFVVFNHKAVDATNDTSIEAISTTETTDSTDITEVVTETITTEFVDNTTEEVEVITTEETVEPTEDIVETTTENNIFDKIKDSTENNTTKVTERPTERTTEKVTEKPVERTTEKQPVETKTTEKATEKLVETKTTEKPVGTKPETKTTEKATEKPVETKTTEKPAAHTHSYTSKVTKAATCTAAGTKTYTCSCGDSYTETIKATGHKFGKEWHTTVQIQEQITEKVTYYIGYNGYNFNDHGYTTKKQVQDKINNDLINDISEAEGGCGCSGYKVTHKTVEIQPAKYKEEYYHTCEICGHNELIRTVE